MPPQEIDPSHFTANTRLSIVLLRHGDVRHVLVGVEAIIVVSLREQVKPGADAEPRSGGPQGSHELTRE